MVINAPLIEAGQESVDALDWVPCICYPIQFKKNEFQIQALINSDGEINVITLGHASKLGLKIYFTDVKARKIKSSTFKILEIILTSLQVKDTLKRAWFFEKTFLLTDLSIKIVLKMLFLTLSIANIKFA